MKKTFISLNNCHQRVEMCCNCTAITDVTLSQQTEFTLVQLKEENTGSSSTYCWQVQVHGAKCGVFENTKKKKTVKNSGLLHPLTTDYVMSLEEIEGWRVKQKCKHCESSSEQSNVCNCFSFSEHGLESVAETYLKTWRLDGVHSYKELPFYDNQLYSSV